MVMALSAEICGADGWDDIEEFARVKFDWHAWFLNLIAG